MVNPYSLKKNCLSKAARRKKRWAEWQKFLEDDEDYDYAFIVRVLGYKISRVRKHIEEHNIIKDAEKVCAQMERVEKLLVGDDDMSHEKRVKRLKQAFDLTLKNMWGWWD